MFGIGGFELLLIAVFILLVFGPDRLPEIGRMLGRGIRMFNDARTEVEQVVRTEIIRPEDMEAFRALSGKRPYTSSTIGSAAARPAAKPTVSAQRELEAKREAEAARIEAERTAAEAAKLAAEAEAAAAEAELLAADAADAVEALADQQAG